MAPVNPHPPYQPTSTTRALSPINQGQSTTPSHHWIQFKPTFKEKLDEAASQIRGEGEMMTTTNGEEKMGEQAAVRVGDNADEDEENGRKE